MDYSQMKTFDNDGVNGKLILTANNMGFMSTNPPDEYVQAIIDFSSSADGPVADLGCAYGYNARLLLEAGTKAVIANDLFEDHLEMFQQSLTEEERKRTSFLPGDAMQVCADMQPASLAGILAANWLHFLTGENIRKTFGLFYKALKPGGLLVVTTASTRQGLIGAAMTDLETGDAEDEEWPGFLHRSKMKRLTHLADHVPDFVHFLDPAQLIREAELAGFQVKKASYVPRHDYPESYKMDGKEASGLMALKAVN